MTWILKMFSRLMPLWVVLLGTVGFFYPGLLVPLGPYLKWFFMLTMVGVGALLDFKEFLPFIKKPQLVLLGSLTQFIVMPLLGFLVGHMFNFPPEVTFGFVLVGAVPGAMASNIITYLAGADVAYSISITTTSTFLSPLVSPFVTKILAGTTLPVDFWQMCRSILFLVVFPLLAGMILRRLFWKHIKPFKLWFPVLSTIAIAVICAVVVAKNKNLLVQLSVILCAGVVIHNGLGFLGGWGSGCLFRLDKKMKKTLCIEVGMQNAGLGAMLASTLFVDKPAVALPSALFASWCVVTASFLAAIWRAREKNDD